MKNILSILSCLFLFVSCQNTDPKKEAQSTSEEKGFEIIGEVENFDDSTKLFLSIDNVNVDSTFIINGKFQFRGTLNAPTKVTVKTSPAFAYKSFWIEEGTTKIMGSLEAFRSAAVEGGRTQQEEEQLNKTVDQLEFQMDSMMAVAQKVRSGALKMTDEEKLAFRAKYIKLEESEDGIYLDFIKAHPNSYVSLNLLNIYNTTWGKEKTEELFEILNEKLKAQPKGENIARYITLNKDIELEKPFVDFESTDAKGKKVSLSDYEGKYILLEFWASWCGPCRAENPELVNTYNEFKDKGFEIFGVSIDINEKQWKAAIKKDGLPWVNVSDLKGDNSDAAFIYGISAIPDNFLIDPNGTIIDRNLRGLKLKDRLAELFVSN